MNVTMRFSCIAFLLLCTFILGLELLLILHNLPAGHHRVWIWLEDALNLGIC